MAGPARAENPFFGECIHSAPIAEAGAQIFISLLERKDPNMALEQYFYEFGALSERLITHATDRKSPVQRDAFLIERPGIVLKESRGGGGDGPVLGWMFEGIINTQGRPVDIHVEKTDIVNGEGVLLTMKLSEGDNSLIFYARQGYLPSARVDIAFTGKGKNLSLILERPSSRETAGPLFVTH